MNAYNRKLYDRRMNLRDLNSLLKNKILQTELKKADTQENLPVFYL